MTKNLQNIQNYNYTIIIVVIFVIIFISILFYLYYKKYNIIESYYASNNTYQLEFGAKEDNNIRKLDIGLKSNGANLFGYQIIFTDNTKNKKASKTGDDYYISVKNNSDPKMKLPKLGLNIIQ